MSRHPKADIYLAERAKGKTYREIAEQYGVSFQCVAIVCGKQDNARFRGWTAERCVYPNVRNWMNENKVSLKEFVRRMGEIPSSKSVACYSAYFKGSCYPSKAKIDKMLAVTGLTYEKFWEEDNG